MKILVTGANGMLGDDVVIAAREAGHEVTALGRDDLDITDAGRVSEVVGAERPDSVINCAAWTDVDGAEGAEEEATRVNGEGAGNLARATAAVEASVVYPSSDYVFDGGKDGAYVESDPTGPLSAYGRSKLAGERATLEANPRHHVVRTAWVFGPTRKNFVKTMLGLGAERERIQVVSDQVGCPTYTGHLAAGLLRAAEGDGFGIRHMAGSGSCSWFEFTEEIFRRAAIDCEVEPVTSDEFPRPAPRPANSVLASERDDAIALPAWQEGLDEYLERRAEVSA